MHSIFSDGNYYGDGYVKNSNDERTNFYDVVLTL